MILYHLWPTRLAGGYVGVDVFFAISGFLIIGHLLREIDRDGRVSLRQFWARRARRLLPASLFVLITTGIATVIWVPVTLWQQWFKEIGASAIYVQNWVLSIDAVDYLGSENDPSAVQQFWSLSVEEQFYIFWPLAIVAILAVSSRFPSIPPKRAIGAVLALLTVASFIYSAVAVTTDPAPAYFVTPSRAWEFGAGGVLALFASADARNMPAVRTAVSWAGIAALTAAVFLFTAQTPFPGVAALLPIAGTLAVIWAGTPSTSWAPSTLMSLRPVQWIGEISYSLYLWHWPLLVIAPYALTHDLGVRSRLAILTVSFLLAWATKVLLEDPARKTRMLVSRPAWVTLAATVAATLLIVTASGTGYIRTGENIAASAAAAEKQLERDKACAGAMAVVSGCPAPYAPTELTNPAFAAIDIGKGVQISDECKQTLEDSTLLTCTIGDVENATTSIALIGDSHAGHFLEALDLYGQDNRIRFITYIKTWCAGTGAEGVAPTTFGTPAGTASCAEWGAAVLDVVASDPSVDAAVFSNFTQSYATPAANGSGRMVTAADFEQAWEHLTAAGKKVVALRDIPNAGAVGVPDCVAANPDAVDPCTIPVSEAGLATSADPMLLAADKLVAVIDLYDVFCDDVECHTLIGGLVAYFGSHHMTATFARTLAPIVGERITNALI